MKYIERNFNNNLITCIILFLVFIIIIFPNFAEAKIFNPVATDQSIKYLSMIFGNKFGGIVLNEGSSNNFFSNILQIFNGFVLSIAIIILSYVSIISTINTAQEGQMMGKKWSSIWIPLRSIIGLLLLAPIPGSGYSSLQILIIWIVLNSIGAANYLWNIVLNNLSQGISVIQKEEINKKDLSTLKEQGTALAKDLFDSLACLKIINDTLDKDLRPEVNAKPRLSYYFEEELTDPIVGPVKLHFGINPKQSPQHLLLSNDHPISKNLCGTIVVSASWNQKSDSVGPNKSKLNLNNEQRQQVINLAYQSKLSRLHIMLEDISRIFNYLSFTTNPIANLEEQNNITLETGHLFSGYLYKAIEEYQKSISNLNKQAVMSSIGLNTELDRQAISDTIIQQSKDFGWVTAGSYYYLFSQSKVKNLLYTATEKHMLENPPIHKKEPNKGQEQINASGLGITYPKITSYKKALSTKAQSINNLFTSPEELIVTDNLSITKHSQEEFDLNLESNFLPIINKLLENPQNESIANLIKPYIKQFSDLNKIVIQDLQNCLSNKHEDPLLSQASFGVHLMQLAEDFWIKIINNSIITNFIDGENNLKGITITLLAPILILGGIIWTMGASLSVYLPMVPYMMFIVTVLGWFLLIIEAVVAAPIVALGFIMPSQDELGKITPALGILTNIFLKPILTTLGLIIAAKLYNTIITMVNMGFKFSFSALQSQTGTTMFAWIVVLILYSSFIVTLVNKCYSLIYQLPDKLLRWIGITGEQTDMSSIKETQQSFDQSSKQGAAPLEGIAGGAASKLKENFIAATKKDGSGLLTA